MRKSNHTPKQMERPILFKGDMVRAILDGRKTQTRRIGAIQNHSWTEFEAEYHTHATKGIEAVATYRSYPTTGTARTAICACPYGVAGDRLWVRETWRPMISRANSSATQRYAYRADHPSPSAFDGTWKPAIHMPRVASRITLEITGIRVERLQEISEADAKAEGVFPCPACGTVRPHEHAYQTLWDAINGNGAWEKNPWAWVISFCRVGNENQPTPLLSPESSASLSARPVSDRDEGK